MHPPDPPPPKPQPTSREPSRLARGREVEVVIEKLVYGGDGLARADGQVVFVPYSAPGDRLRVRIVEAGRGFARGAIVEVLAPGPARRAPRCRHFGVCGGCSLQHVDYAAQRAAKAEFVRESLRRLGGIEWTAEIPVLHAAEYGWRARAEVQARRGHAGWFRAGTHEIVDVEECPVLVPELEARVRALAADPPRHAVTLAAGDDGAVSADERAAVRHRVAGFEFEAAPGTFFQGNRLLVEDLVATAVGDATGDLAVDLYAGVGLFTLPLARRFARVVAIESHPRTARLGAANAERNGVSNAAFEAADVETRLAAGFGGAPDLVLLDPPRTGAGESVVRAIAALSPQRITYVSCDPPTLARDLRVSSALGHRLESLVALDMFPQTHHVEVVARLAWTRAVNA